MSLLEIPCASITILTNSGLTIEALSSETRVVQAVTEEVFSAELKIDYEWLKDQESIKGSIEIGQTIDIYLRRGESDPWYHAFSGRIWSLQKDIEGHSPRWYLIHAKGWGKYLQDEYTGYRRTVGPVTDVLQWIVQPLIDEGKLSNAYIESSTIEVVFNHPNDWISRWDAVAEICDQVDWDFYVDNQRIFRAFTRGSRFSIESFENKITRVSYILDGERIINSQRVIGSSGKTLGSDSEYTESALNWTSDGFVSSTRNLSGDKVVDPDPRYGAGQYVIQAHKSDATGGIYLQRNFDPPLDLSMFGTLKFSFKYVFGAYAPWWNVGRSVKLSVRYMTDSDNYFEYIYELSGVKPNKVALWLGWQWVFGWAPVELNFNLYTSKSPPNIVGNPRWDSISAIRFTVLEPLPYSEYPSAYLMIDNMRFEKGFYSAFHYDSTSIEKYGERRGPLIYDPNLNSDAKCAALADQILEAYKDPLPIFQELEINDIAITSPGHKVTISVAEIQDVEVLLRRKEIILDQFDLRTRMDLAPVRIPSLERLLERFAKKLEDLEEVRLSDEISAAMVAGFFTSPIGEHDINVSRSQDNLVKNSQFEVDADLDGIPDAWYPSDSSKVYRTQDEVRFGQFAARIPEGCTLESELFPIDPSGGYFGELWAKGYDGSSQGTLSAYMIYYGASPTFEPLRTVSFCEEVSPLTWTRYNFIDDVNNVPVNARWGRVRLVGEKGSANFFDDITVQRLIGIDGGKSYYVRPVEWSTSQTSPVLVWSDTWDPNAMDLKYVLTRVGADLKSGGGNGYAALKVVLKANDTPKDTFNWATLETSYQRYQKNGSMDVTDFGDTLILEYYLHTQAGEGDVAYMRNPEAWVNVVALKERARNPFDDQEPI